MASITKSTLFTNSWSSIYSILNNRSNVADPLGSTSRKFIYARLPNTKSPSFAGFPYIVLHQPNIIQNRESVNAKRKNVMFSMDIEVHTQDINSNGIPHGNGQTYLNNISDDIFETLNSMTIKQSLRLLGVDNVKIQSNNVTLDFDEHENIVFIRTFSLQFSGKRDVY